MFAKPDSTERKNPGFLHGLRTVPRALEVLQQVPHVLRLLLIPLLLTALLDGLGLYFGFSWLRARIVELLPEAGGLAVVRGLLTLLAGAVVLFALAWTFGFVYLTLCELVIDSVSEEVEQHLTGHHGSASDLHSKLRGLLTSIVQSVLLSLGGLVAWLIGLIPLVGPLLAVPLLATLLGYGFFSIAAGRKAYGLSARLQLARGHFGALLGLGLPVFLCNLIPIVNLLALPVFVVAGTLLFLDTSAPPPPLAGGAGAAAHGSRR